MDRICALLEAYHIPVITVPGYEADDVLGTLARRANVVQRDRADGLELRGRHDAAMICGARAAVSKADHCSAESRSTQSGSRNARTNKVAPLMPPDRSTGGRPDRAPSGYRDSLLRLPAWR